MLNFNKTGFKSFLFFCNKSKGVDVTFKDKFKLPALCSIYRPVNNASEIMQILGGVLKRRVKCPTLIHADSSRSHLVVSLTVSTKSPNALALGEKQTCTVLQKVLAHFSHIWETPLVNEQHHIHQETGKQVKIVAI